MLVYFQHLLVVSLTNSGVSRTTLHHAHFCHVFLCQGIKTFQLLSRMMITQSYFHHMDYPEKLIEIELDHRDFQS